MRLAGLSDIPEMAQLVNSCYRGEESRKGWTTEAEFLDGQRVDAQMLRELLEDSNVRLLLWHASGGKELVAVCECRHFPLEKTVELGMISVAPALQGSGIGKRVLNEAEEFARENFVASVSRMWVISLRQSLIEWYQRRGYCLGGKKKEFPMDDPRYGLPKVGNLEFVEMVKSL